MDIGIGLPAHLGSLEGRRLLEWARKADELGFSSIGVIDRVVYDNYEALTALACAAAVTERIRLLSEIIIAPLRPNAALFAKQAATVHRVSNGRLVLGLAPGGRADDYEAGGVDFEGRGRSFDRQLRQMKRVWNGEEGIGPAPVQSGGPPIIIGGNGPAAFRRVAMHDGWIAGGGGAERFRQGAESAVAAWTKAGRAGKPRLQALIYYSLGPGAVDNAHDGRGNYYAFTGRGEIMAAAALTSPEAVRDAIKAYETAGCDELSLIPCSAGMEQIEMLTDALP